MKGLSTAVREVFVRLYKEGLIYKGDYIVNWCPRCHTALADDEVDHEETRGKLYHIRYPLQMVPAMLLLPQPALKPCLAIQEWLYTLMMSDTVI